MQVYTSIDVLNLMFLKWLVLAVLTSKVQGSAHVSAVVFYGLNNFRKERFKQKNSNGILQTLTDGLFVPDKLAMFIYNVVRASTSLLYTVYSHPKREVRCFYQNAALTTRSISSRLCLPNSKLSCTLLNSPLPALYLLHSLKFYLVCSILLSEGQADTACRSSEH
jgi:hypothetical protein